MSAKRSKLFTGTAITAAVVLALIAPAGAEKPTTIQAGNVQLRLNSGYVPKAISRTTPTPVAFTFSASIRTIDETHPPALSRILIAADKNSAIDVRGLPVCPFRIQQQTTRTVEESCRKAIVGSGIANFVILFPETPIADEGRVIVSNGGVRGNVTTLYAQTYSSIPTATAIVFTIKIKELEHGPFGSEATISIPRVAGGSGSLTDFSLTIGGPFTGEGKVNSIVAAKCPDGKIRSQVEASFKNGTTTDAKLAHRCTPRT